MLTHVNQAGQAAMVDVSEKAITTREARASGYVQMQPHTLALIAENQVKKGDVLAVARIAGIQAAKLTSQLIPLCHPLALSKVQVEFEIDQVQSRVWVHSYCKLAGQTGVEMEALTAVSIAALTIFDMCKAADPSMVISQVQVDYKAGGKTGEYSRNTGVSHG